MHPAPQVREEDAERHRFATDMIRHATAAGILTPASQGLRGVENYLLLAHAVTDPRCADGHPAVPDWRGCATLLGRYELVVASGDYGVFDAVLHDDEEAERRRVNAATQYLTHCLREPDTAWPAPDIAGGRLVAALGREYQDLVRAYLPRAHPQVLEGWRSGLADLLNGMARHRACPHPTFPFDLVDSLAAGTSDVATAVHRVEERYGDAIPDVLLEHLSALMVSPDPDDRDQLLLLLRTAEEGNTIGAGALLQSVALHGSPHEVTDTALRALNDAGWLCCYRARIANHRCDLNNSALRDSVHEEHSGERVWYCLLSDAPGERFADSDLPRETAQKVTRACLRAENWLADALADQIRTLWRAWPWVGAACCRLAHLGQRVYDVQHYALLSRSQFAALFDELNHPEDHPFLARCNPAWES
jgi:hypothetical protein